MPQRRTSSCRLYLDNMATQCINTRDQMLRSSCDIISALSWFQISSMSLGPAVVVRSWQAEGMLARVDGSLLPTRWEPTTLMVVSKGSTRRRQYCTISTYFAGVPERDEMKFLT